MGVWRTVKRAGPLVALLSARCPILLTFASHLIIFPSLRSRTHPSLTQVAAYCGVHCLNTLLQGPHFTEDDLATIASGLDAEEARLLKAAGVPAAGGGSGGGSSQPDFSNAAAGGMFSLQVLERALNRLSLGAVNINRAGAEGIKASPAAHDAFVCNRAEHWWAVRKLDGQYWDLNSMAPCPRPLADLASHLAATPNVYAITGRLPARRPPAPRGGIRTMADIAPGGGRGKWWPPADARATAGRGGGGGGGGGGGSAVDSLFKSAARFAGGGAPPPSMPRPSGGGGGGRAGEDDPELAAAIAASLADAEPGDRGFGQQALAGGGGAAAGAPSVGGAGRRQGGSDAPPPPAAAAPAPPPAPAAPLPEEPPAGQPGTLTIAARLPDGSRAARRFAGGDLPAAVCAWVASLLPGGGPAALAAHRLVSPPLPGCPSLELDGASSKSLAEEGLASGVMFNVVRR